MKNQKSNKQSVHANKEIDAPRRNPVNTNTYSKTGDFQNNLVRFSQEEKNLRISRQDYFKELYHRMQNGAKVIKKLMEAEEKNNSSLAPESRFENFEQGAKKELENLKKSKSEEQDPTKSMQELLDLDWAFMDRAYNAAKMLLQDKKFLDAHSAFMMLRYLNPDVFEYWFWEATALYELGKFQDALDIFGFSLLLQPNNPYVFFQMGNCLFKCNEVNSALKSLDICIEYAKNNPKFVDLAKDAIKAKGMMEGRKAA